MIAQLRHRGPDGFGLYLDNHVGLAHSRLSIIDLEGGWQPLANEDETIWITFNGEVFNYVELRQDLISRGHTFRTHSDTETIIHLYEEFGTDCLGYLNGQFAFAIWDSMKNTLFIARDRMGIRPLFYTKTSSGFFFASEIKALFANPDVPRALDVTGLDQIFTLWCTMAPRTVFKDIHELPAGHFLEVRNGDITVKQYWDVSFSLQETSHSADEWTEMLRAALVDSTRLQLRADVPVGAYLSGGLDSSVTAALIRNYTGSKLRTFSLAFEDKEFDESGWQQQMAKHLGTDHSVITCTTKQIGEAFPNVIWHTEKPILRTAPTPLFFLSKLVRDSGYKVVLTGEGADEVLAGYDLFKEAKIRQFWARFPESKKRPLLLQRLYPYLSASPAKLGPYTRKFFDPMPEAVKDPCYGHYPRWKTTGATRMFFSKGLLEKNHEINAIQAVRDILPRECGDWDFLSQAQYVEMKTLLAGYLLSSQGDRVAMANSIEGRFPYLDHNVVELCATIPPRLRMKVLTEKHILRESMKDLLPEGIGTRTKQPYRAPDAASFFLDGRPLDYVEELLSPEIVERADCFNPAAVAKLVAKAKEGDIIGFKDNMALVGIISTQLVHSLFIDNFKPAKLMRDDEIKVTRIFHKFS